MLDLSEPPSSPTHTKWHTHKARFPYFPNTHKHKSNLHHVESLNHAMSKRSMGQKEAVLTVDDIKPVFEKNILSW